MYIHVVMVFVSDWLTWLYRYIIHSDDHNPYLDSMEHFAEKLEDFKPDLLVVGGLQMMDNFPFQSGKRTLVTTLLVVVDLEPLAAVFAALCRTSEM